MEQSDIKLDFEQFMRIFTFEKNRPAGLGNGASTSQAKDSSNLMAGMINQSFHSPPQLKTPSPEAGRNLTAIGSRKLLSTAAGGPKQTSAMNSSFMIAPGTSSALGGAQHQRNLSQNSSSKRPQSSFGIMISEQKRQLVKESREIRRSMN